MEKSPDAFRTISEVAEWLGIQAHVLRFWESKFSQVKPVKRAGGRRYYRPSDMQLLGGIKTLLHDDGLTIKGVQKILREQGVSHVTALSPSIEDGAAATLETSGNVLKFKEKDGASTVSESAANEPDRAQSEMAFAPSSEASATGTETDADTPVIATDETADSSESSHMTSGEPETEQDAGEAEAPLLEDAGSGDQDNKEPYDSRPDQIEAEGKSTADLPHPVTAETGQTQDQIPPAAMAEDVEPEPATPALPSFLHRSGTSRDQSTREPDKLEDTTPDPAPVSETADTNQQATEEPAEMQDEPVRVPKPAIVDIPDLPAEASIPVIKGSLATAAGLRRLTPAWAERIAPVAARLAAHRERMLRAGRD